jgi:3-hydroxybutyryl-CoA dehydrogenase
VKVERVGVLGAGTMGSGIAQIAALGGYETVVYDPDPVALAVGGERARVGIAKGVERGRWSQADGDTAATLLAGVSELEGLAGCELVVEAVPEILELKRELLGSVAAVCGPETVLASNTSSLQVSEIAAEVPGRERVVGMHFFNPPPLMKLVEVVATEDSTEEALRMLGDGLAEPEAIDRAYKLGGGFRMGPFELIDLIGVDVNLTIARSFFVQGGEPERWRPSPIQEQMVSEGRLGRKSGQGFYEYDESGKPVVPSAPISKLRNPAIDEEILQRLYAQIANEAHFALEDEVASPADMNTATRLGLNWPRGSIEIAEELGLGEALATLERLRAEHGEAYAPAPLLRERATAEGS